MRLLCAYPYYSGGSGLGLHFPAQPAATKQGRRDGGARLQAGR